MDFTRRALVDAYRRAALQRGSDSPDEEAPERGALRVLDELTSMAIEITETSAAEQVGQVEQVELEQVGRVGRVGGSELRSVAKNVGSADTVAGW